ncbi:DoxX family protein [Halobaculum gomorrense]|uniref:Uncharacterized membrane protein n=1 Tax=Halobaculum gomorrense TaxID=43928 RepID=A0A1M5KHQ4_9EURY|nr:DoxX-like family protein [Halobaculum gomorrense]SHG52245.1 Uncharacterized membrane protein [Halobaculum gomorrense]
MHSDTFRLRSTSDGPLVYVMGLLYVAAGVAHFVAPGPLARIVPEELPAPRALVYLSGLAEVLLGVGVLFPRTRRSAAKGLILLLLAVFPANVTMATRGAGLDAVPERARPAATAAAWVRLPLQGALIAWAWSYACAGDDD